MPNVWTAHPDMTPTKTAPSRPVLPFVSRLRLYTIAVYILFLALKGSTLEVWGYISNMPASPTAPDPHSLRLLLSIFTPLPLANRGYTILCFVNHLCVCGGGGGEMSHIIGLYPFKLSCVC